MNGARDASGAPTAPAHLLLRPRVFFPALAAIVLLSVLFTPRSGIDNAAPNLTTRSSAPQGASGLAETARRLGWRVTRLEQPPSDSLAPNAIYAVLVPDSRLTVDEVHKLFDRVRAGASLMLIAAGGALRDSLHVFGGDTPSMLAPGAGDSVACPDEPRLLRNLTTTLPMYSYPLAASGPLPADTVHLASLMFRGRRESERRPMPAMLGIRMGRGRIVTLADARLLTNDVIRVCRWGAGVATVRALEWLAARDSMPPLRTIVFDEYHHGFGSHPSVTRATAAWLERTVTGRTAGQLALAALLLLAAAAARPIPPLPRARVQRRSPLEHVNALAQAYERVRATRTTARLLVQGLRRRTTPVAAPRRSSDEEFLAALSTRRPAMTADVVRATEAMARPVDARELLDIAHTIDRIERSLRP